MLSDFTDLFENRNDYMDDTNEYEEPSPHITDYRTNANEAVDLCMLNSIVQHPFIDDLSINLDKISFGKHNLILILYRINKHIKSSYVEYYLPNGKFISPILSSNENLIDDLKKTICDVSGAKRIKGTLFINDQCYIFIQVRNNKLPTDWLVSWDILANKHVFGENINQTTCELFLKLHRCDDLYLNNHICIKPIVLYCSIEERYRRYINKHNTIQYCMVDGGPLITLHSYQPSDNVRNICFVGDTDNTTNLSDLHKQPYITSRNESITNWIFRYDSVIISYMK